MGKAGSAAGVGVWVAGDSSESTDSGYCVRECTNSYGIDVGGINFRLLKAVSELDASLCPRNERRVAKH